MIYTLKKRRKMKKKECFFLKLKTTNKFCSFLADENKKYMKQIEIYYFTIRTSKVELRTSLTSGLAKVRRGMKRSCRKGKEINKGKRPL